MSGFLDSGLIEAGGAGYQIQRSLRLRASATAYLARTFGAGDTQKWTWSAWVKLGLVSSGTSSVLFGTAGAIEEIRFISDGGASGVVDSFQVTNPSGSVRTLAVNRDPIAWAHFCVSVDTTQATAANRVRIYKNGLELAHDGASIYPALNANTVINSAVEHDIGKRASGASLKFDGYCAEEWFVGGSALLPTAFGQFDAVTGQWAAKKYTGSTSGVNTSYLPFSDTTSPTTLCNDASGNGNNWTPNNISTTAGATYDSMTDVPLAYGTTDRGNYCTINPLAGCTNGTAVTYKSGNLLLDFNQLTGRTWELATIALPLSGKYYFEFVQTAGSQNPPFTYVGLLTTTLDRSNYDAPDGGSRMYNLQNGQKKSNATQSAYGASAALNDVIGIAVDMSGGTLEFFKNNTSQGVAFTDIASSGLPWVFGFWGQGGTTGSVSFNFGQRPFQYTPPTGFKALHTGNLPTPTGAALEPRKHFDVALATGANIKTTAEAVFPSNFMEWIKDRANVNNHQLIDTVRGTSAVLQSNTTAAETTYVAPSGSSVGWLWKAGGAAVTNTAGSISSQVSANVAGGFSIVTYTGTGAAATVGHGLGATPKMVIAKNRVAVAGWPVYHAAQSASPGNNYMMLNETAATGALSTVWNNTQPTSSVFSIGTSALTSGTSMVAYCWSEVPGYSKFGSYTGNGSADGPFVYCGFRPRYLMVKRTDAAGDWAMVDSARDVSNPESSLVYPNLSNAENVSVVADFAATGFKVRAAGGSFINTSGATYIFAAFAEAPFQYALGR